MSSVILQDVTKIFGSRQDTVIAVDKINLTMNDGDFVAFLGPSGCGKTSTLRMIAGLEEISSGKIWLGDKFVNNLSPSQRDIAMAFETYSLYSHMSVGENIGFCLRAKKYPKDEIAKRVDQIASILNISDILSKKPSELSGGQQQMVSLARALIRRPAVFLLDEPLSHLDSGARNTIREMIKLLHYEIETTMIYVTHDQVEALALADQIVVMNQGKIEQVGTRNDIYHRPASVFVAEFIGDPPINMLECEPNEGQSLVQVGKNGNGGMRFIVEEMVYKAIKDSDKRKVLVGIRPQDLSISTEGMDNLESITGEVVVFEFIGEYSKVLIECNGISIMAVVPADAHFNIGDNATLFYDPEKINVFDPTTTSRISVES